MHLELNPFFSVTPAYRISLSGSFKKPIYTFFFTEQEFNAQLVTFALYNSHQQTSLSFAVGKKREKLF